MKVEGPNSLRPGTVRRAGRSSGGAAGAFASEVAGSQETAAAAGVGSTAALDSVEALLAVQEVDDPLERRDRKLRQHGEELLDRLDEIRNGLLMGAIPHERLEALAARLAEQRERASDPRLAAVLQEIELRAKVELAKLAAI